MDAVLRDRLTLVAALGAGVVVGISGIYMYYKINRSVNREISQLAGTIENLKKEIAELKATSISTKSSSSSLEKKPSQKPPETQQQPVRFAPTSSVEDEEEFYDFTDTEDPSSWASVNGPSSTVEATNIFDPTWLDRIDAMLDGNAAKKESAYFTLKNRKAEFLENADFLWRLAKAAHLCGIVAHKRGEMEKKKDLAFEAHENATKALKANDSNPEVHKWVAITVGSLAEYVSIKDKIQNGYIFKEHVDKAIELKPLDPTLHHMLGRFCFEVASLSWIERKAAATLYSAPPESTLEESRTHLLKSDSIKSNWKENILYIGKTYVGEGEYENAMEWIDKAIALPNQSEDDEIAHIELEMLQHKYKSYRS